MFTNLRRFAYGFICVVTLIAPFSLKACNLSCFILDSLQFNGSSYTAYTTLCIGGGVVGGVFGADNSTSTFGIASFGGSGTIIGYSPDTLISDHTMALVDGFLISGTGVAPPSVSPFLGGSPDSATSYVIYANQSISPYTCLTSTLLCGVPRSDCKNIVFTLSALPDSMVAIGIEGAGNPAIGCHQVAQPFSQANKMTIYFSPPLVAWGDFSAGREGNGVVLDWEVVSEENKGEFKVMRSNEGRNWIEIGSIDATQSQLIEKEFHHRDAAPFPGENYYRIDHFDPNGESSSTEIRRVFFDQTSSLSWESIVPNPTERWLNVAFHCETKDNMELELFSSSGMLLGGNSIEAEAGSNSMQMDLEGYPVGVYYVRLKGSQGALTRKVIKI